MEMRSPSAVVRAVLLACSSATMLAQVSVPPIGNVKVEYEDARIRVSRVKLAPNETLESRQWLSDVQVPLTSSNVSVTCKDRQPYKVMTLAGKPGWSEARECSVTNGAGTFESVVVELKNATDVARPLEGPPNPTPANYLDEPLHHWAFENQYVRVYDVHLPKGVITGYHTHAIDTLFVEISGGTEAAQMQGSEEWRSSVEKPGEIAFSPDSKKTRIHRVRNDGNDEYHVVAVQILTQPSN